MAELRAAISELAKGCDTMEREFIEDMIVKAADYVQIVVRMETAAANVADRKGSELRDAVENLDKARRAVHNGLISSVDVVNRICDAHGCPRLYTGGELRRNYGDFAIALVGEIFGSRN